MANDTLNRHSEGRALARRLGGWPRALVLVPSFEARRERRRAPQDDGNVGLKMTAVSGWLFAIAKRVAIAGHDTFHHGFLREMQEDALAQRFRPRPRRVEVIERGF